MSGKHGRAVLPGWEKPATAFILIETDLGRESELVGFLRSLPGVVEAYPLYWLYDVIAKLRAGSEPELHAAILRVKGMEGVRAAVVLPSVGA